MADTSTAHIDILRDIAQSESEIDAAIYDMRETVIRTRGAIEQTRKLLRDMTRPSS
jgi:vacuolar-type H+-ATPase subunit H